MFNKYNVAVFIWQMLEYRLGKTKAGSCLGALELAIKKICALVVETYNRSKRRK